MNAKLCSGIVSVLLFACGDGPVDQKEKEMKQNRLRTTSVLLPDLVPGEIQIVNEFERSVSAVLSIEGMTVRFSGFSKGNDISLSNVECGSPVRLELHYTDTGSLAEGVLHAAGREVTFTPGKHETHYLKGPPVNGSWQWDFGTFKKTFPLRKVGQILVANVGTDDMGNIIASCLLWGEVDPSGEFFLQSDEVTWTGLFHGPHWGLADVLVKIPSGATGTGYRSWTSSEPIP